jgi:hypothetical protein
VKKRKAKPDIVQSTLRLPRALWRRINNVAAINNLSMQQAVQEAITEYCRRAAKGVDLRPLLRNWHPPYPGEERIKRERRARKGQRS